MNVNEFARQICKEEGKKKETNIAQVKEVLSCARKIFKRYARKYIDIDLYTLIHRL